MSTALTLYELEDTLVAMLDSMEMVEDPAARLAAEQELIALHLTAVAKRDKVSQFLAHCDNQENFITDEINRLTELRRHFTSTRDRVENYVVHTIQSLGKDDRDRWRKLDGKTCSFSIARNPASTEITSLDELPDEYKDLTVKLSAIDWAEFIGELDIEQRSALLGKVRLEASARKLEVKKALAAGEVPGARLSDESYRLNRK